MRRLLWKEWQEQMWWVLPWLLVTVVVSALGWGFHPINTRVGISSWASLMPALALLSGLAGYGSELKGERAIFLYSRAVSWKQVLAAKVLFGIIAALIVSVAGTAASVLCCPEVYRSVITPASLGNELLLLAAFTGILYLGGLACSIVLPGLAGSVLVLLAGTGLVAVSIYTTSEICHRHNTTVFLQAALMLLPVILTVVIARFGLTLPLRERATRAAVIMVGVVAGGLLLELSPIGKAVLERWYSDRTYYWVSASPSGQYYYVHGARGNNRFTHQWLRVTDGRRFALPYPKDDPCYWRRWLDGDLLIIRPNPEAGRHSMMSVTRWTESGPQTLSLRDWDSAFPNDKTPVLVSPDRQRLVIVHGVYFQIFDLAANRAAVYNWKRQALVSDIDRTPIPVLTNLRGCWWNSDTVISYLEPKKGEQRSLDVRTLPELTAAEAK